MSQPLMTKKIRWIERALLIPVFCAPLACLAEGILNLQDYALYDKSVSVPPAVQAECGLEGKIVGYVQSSARGFDKIVLVPDATKAGAGKSLVMKIAGISGVGGGAWSGPKNLTIEGTLRENGQVTGTFRATRFSGGGAFGAYKGTCAILDRCAKTLGTDVATWLANPIMNARLGDEK
jgi:hypothetical protein